MYNERMQSARRGRVAPGILFRLFFNNSEEARRVRFVLLDRIHLGMRLHYCVAAESPQRSQAPL